MRLQNYNAIIAEGKGHMTNWKALTIGTAVKQLVEHRQHQLAPNTIRSWTQAGAQLQLFLKKKPCGQVTTSDLERYQSVRTSTGASPRTVNLEIAIARLALKRAGVWGSIADRYKPIRVHSKPGKAITSNEQSHLLTIARSKPRWRNAADALVLGFYACMRSQEIRSLQWKHVNLESRVLQIEASKTPAGHRAIPINEPMHAMLSRRLQRAIQKRSAEPEHFLFYHSQPHRPLGSFANAYANIRKAAGLPTTRFHDTRHTAITTLCEAGVPDWIIRAQVGHVDPTMLAYYSHVRMSALRQAGDALEGRKPPANKTEEPCKSPSDSNPVPRPESQLSLPVSTSTIKSKSTEAPSGTERQDSTSTTHHRKSPTKATESKSSTSHPRHSGKYRKPSKRK